MGKFLDFLKESKIDQELNELEEEFFSITEDGNLVKEFQNEDDLSLEEIAALNNGETISEEKEQSENKIEHGFGGEVYVSLDFPQLQSLVKEKKEKKDSATLVNLLKRKDAGDSDDIDKEIRKFTKYQISDDGKSILKYDADKDEYVEMAQDDIEKILKQKNKGSDASFKSNKLYDFDEEGNLCTVTKQGDLIPLKERFQRNCLKKLNDKVNSRGLHFRFFQGGSKLMVNTTPWTADGEEENVRDKTRFDKAQYTTEPIDDDTQKIVLDALNNTVDGKKKGGKKTTDDGSDSENDTANTKQIISYENGMFKSDGVELSGEELQKFINSLNGFGHDTKLLGPKGENGWKNDSAKFWDSYKISIAGSKVGNAVNFNLPPVVTCNSGIPCRKQCYAVKAYAAYPSARASENCNLRLLKKDAGFELFKKSLILALSTPTRDGGKKFNLCRIHVSGDIISTSYLKAICEVAKACDWVNFWMYTKQYEMLAEVSKSSIPGNLCIIVSCWGQFNPFDYKDGKYRKLADDYPLAYLDDGSEEFNEFNKKIQTTLKKPEDIQVCPCTEADEIITRCESCRICFDRSLANNNLVFKLH